MRQQSHRLVQGPRDDGAGEHRQADDPRRAHRFAPSPAPRRATPRRRWPPTAPRRASRRWCCCPKGKVTTAQLVQPLANGALVCALDTDFDGCMAIVQKLTDREGIYLANSMNSLRLEGQKTVGHRDRAAVRLAGSRLGHHPGRQPRQRRGARRRLRHDARARAHRRSARGSCVAQAEKANPLYRAYKQGWDTFEAITAGDTEASAIRIGNPVSVRRAIRALEAFDGVVEQASESGAGRSVRRGRPSTVAYTCPHTGVALAALEKLRAKGLVEPGQRVVVISTANGLKFTDFKDPLPRRRNPRRREQAPQQARQPPQRLRSRQIRRLQRTRSPRQIKRAQTPS